MASLKQYDRRTKTEIPKEPLEMPRQPQEHLGFTAGLAIAAATTLAAIGALGACKKPSPQADPDVSPRNRTSPAIGSLGGVPVAIPPVFAHFVEYQGDPDWLQRDGYKPPERTFASPITSFGFEVRYPDMAGVDETTLPERKRASIYDTAWMRVGVNAASSSFHNLLTQAMENIATKLAHRGPQYQYLQMAEPVFGLVGYAPIGFSDARRREKPPRPDQDDKNIYYHVDDRGRVDTYIECSNVAHDAAPCEHRFLLAPAMQVHVAISYRRGLLSHWQEIQESVTGRILGFRAEGPTAPIRH